ncbi:methyltransferase-like protein 22 [Megalops cyprinoides]|uniref:methyltransferase-like protein 22 n=1 Tax=Megalops cyprinoides TaxID=118141 RepID=UPI0018646298|nr:methyltransferase-like protein 22 [Megalops cyprinoides]XP_036409428.1 methyltransferase-like protein 22 [Megalops cyprinoides]
MDQVTFRSDTVLSDVHLLLPNARHLMTRLNGVGQPVFISRFEILRDCEDHDPGNGTPVTDAEERVCEACGGGEGPRGEGEEEGGQREECGGDTQARQDEDGDLDVVRRPRGSVVLERDAADRDAIHPIILSKGEEAPANEELQEECAGDVIMIEHTMATPLEDAGKQVWRGALLLADFILSQPTLFHGATMLELGAGTGITSIVAATLAKVVYCTDVGQDLLNMCQRNVTLNRHLLKPAGGEVKVRELDWLGDEFCTDSEAEFSWMEEEVADLHDNATLLIAADVCYDDDLTDAMFRTLYRITSNLRHTSVAYLSIEKRLNFTLRHMDVSCEAYDHFRRCLDDLQDITDGKTTFTVEPVIPRFPQFFHYERIEQLELWKVTATPL